MLLPFIIEKKGKVNIAVTGLITDVFLYTYRPYYRLVYIAIYIHI